MRHPRHREVSSDIPRAVRADRLSEDDWLTGAECRNLHRRWLRRDPCYDLGARARVYRRFRQRPFIESLRRTRRRLPLPRDVRR